MKELIGNKIQTVEVDKNNQHYLRFNCVEKDGTLSELIYFAEGECCSESWFSEVLPDWQFEQGNEVVNVEMLEINKISQQIIAADKRTRQEYDEVYGYKVMDNAGNDLIIVFRNSSNGYYGGWCSLINTDNMVYHKGDLDGVEWQLISNDYRA